MKNAAYYNSTKYYCRLLSYYTRFNFDLYNIHIYIDLLILHGVARDRLNNGNRFTQSY